MTTPQHDLKVYDELIRNLTPHRENARRGDVPRIMSSLGKLGQYRPIVVNRGSYTGRPLEILAGHHLVQAATELGWDYVSITVVDVDDENAKRILIADNRTSDLATYDDRLLVELLGSLDDLDGTGFDPGDLDALRAFLDDPGPDHGEDDQDILDKSDQAMWPEVRAKIHPDLHRRWMEIPGNDDAERIDAVLSDIE
jgi:ParB-like chromosome segregation protein Spo0J